MMDITYELEGGESAIGGNKEVTMQACKEASLKISIRSTPL